MSTPPDAPTIRRGLPFTEDTSLNAYSSLKPAKGTADASVKLKFFDLMKARDSFVRIKSAHVSVVFP